MFEAGLAGPPLPASIDGITPSIADRLASLGVTAVVTHFNPHPAVVDVAELERVRHVLRASGIRVVQAGGYRVSLVEPDDEARRAGVDTLRELFPALRCLGAEMFITGCGSHDPRSFYGPHPANHSTAARERLVESLERIRPWAEDAGVTVALECHLLTTLDSPETIRAVLDAVDSAAVRANFDPVNLIGDLRAAYDTGAAMRHMVDVVGDRYARSAHLKDVVVGPGMPIELREAPPGTGLLDMDAFFAACASLGDRCPVIVEHLAEQQTIEAISWLAAAASARGYSLSVPDAGNGG